MEVSKIRHYVNCAGAIIAATHDHTSDSPVICGNMGDIECFVDSRTNITTIKNRGDVVLRVVGEDYHGAFAHHGLWELAIQMHAKKVDAQYGYEQMLAAAV